MTEQVFKEKIFEAGIIGAGGAGFPSHIKLVEGMDYLVINGAECEPLIYTDVELMSHYGMQIITILRDLVRVMHIKKVIWGIKKKHKGLIEELKGLISPEDPIEVCALDNFYPAGDELTLIHNCTGIIIPKGQLPSSQKVMVFNVETLFNMYKIFYEEEPVIYKYVTVGGAVKASKVLKVPIGTSFRELIKNVELEEAEYDVLVGGPMMGRFGSIDETVSKTTKAIILLPKKSLLYYRKQPMGTPHLSRIMSSCSQCQMCTDLCPRNKLGHKVEPHKLMNAFANGIMGNTDALETALGCCGCNTCSYYSCHHDLRPSDLMMLVKRELMSQGIKPEVKEGIVGGTNPYASVPSSRLLGKLGLSEYDKHAEWIEEVLVPAKVAVPISAHIGKPAVACVEVGAKVAIGQKIAEGPYMSVSTTIHSSIQGVVKQITEKEIVIERG